MFLPPTSGLIFPTHSTSLQPISLFLQWGDHHLLEKLQSHWDNELNGMRCEEALKKTWQYRANWMLDPYPAKKREEHHLQRNLPRGERLLLAGTFLDPDLSLPHFAQLPWGEEEGHHSFTGEETGLGESNFPKATEPESRGTQSCVISGL